MVITPPIFLAICLPITTKELRYYVFEEDCAYFYGKEETIHHKKMAKFSYKMGKAIALLDFGDV